MVLGVEELKLPVTAIKISFTLYYDRLISEPAGRYFWLCTVLE
jgi:hypothetical protein